MPVAAAPDGFPKYGLPPAACEWPARFSRAGIKRLSALRLIPAAQAAATSSQKLPFELAMPDGQNGGVRGWAAFDKQHGLADAHRVHVGAAFGHRLISVAIGPDCNAVDQTYFGLPLRLKLIAVQSQRKASGAVLGVT